LRRKMSMGWWLEEEEEEEEEELACRMRRSWWVDGGDGRGNKLTVEKKDWSNQASEDLGRARES
jgi:hypothetical protein